MKPKAGYLPEDGIFPFSGLDTMTPPAQLAPGSSPNVVNFTTFRGTLTKRTGYSQLGTGLGGTVVRLVEFQLLDGTLQLLAFTPTAQYLYAAGVWTSVGSSWSGTEDNYIDIAVGIDTNLGKVLVAVNGVDPPIYWTGSGSFSNLTVNLVGFITAKTVAVYNGYLVFANIKTSSGWEPQTAAWSDTGVFTEWTLGNAGVLPGMAFEGEILRLVPFATNLIVFSRNTIGCLCYINSDVIFGSQIYASGITLVSAAGVAVVSPIILYAGQDNLYFWDGGRQVTAVGDRMAAFWRANQNQTYIGRTELYYDGILGQVRFRFQTGASSGKVLMCESNMNPRVFGDIEKFEKVGFFEQQYGAFPHCFGRYALNASYSQTVLGGVSVAYAEDSSLNDAGSAIAFTWDTGDFVVPQNYKSLYARWTEIEFEASGSAVTVYYSIDQGVTWVSAQVVTLTTAIAVVKVNIDATSRTLRVRFSGSAMSSTFILNWYRIWLRAGGPR